MTIRKPWVPPEGFPETPELQRLTFNLYLEEQPELARIMWFAPPGTRSQMIIQLLAAGLAATDGHVDAAAPPPVRSRSRQANRHQTRLPASAPAAGRGRSAPTVLAARSPAAPPTSPLENVPFPRPPAPSELSAPSDSTESVAPGAATALPQFQVSAASLDSDHTDPDQDPPSSSGFALLSSFRSP